MTRMATAGASFCRTDLILANADDKISTLFGLSACKARQPTSRLEINTIDEPSRDSRAKTNKILLFTKEPRLDITRRVESASDYTERVKADVPSLTINTASPKWGPREAFSNL
ncbi:hypothetical protein ROHU_006954 [Labeo rohita]|uniref:Uncharacterized protein n=1 Tax=Labeo rohita TaxID=84645 RepID=A0A498MJP6_LABRO|nr:hypothetical protein ROHU_006954 [Labeo rohita]